MTRQHSQTSVRNWAAIVVLVVAFGLVPMGSLLAQDNQPAAASAPVDRDQAIKDWEMGAKLVKEWESGLRYQSDFEKNPESFVTRWLELKKKFDPYWKDFTGRYGDDYNKVMQSFQGISQPLTVDSDMRGLYNELQQIPDHQKNIIEWTMKTGDEKYREWRRGKELPDPEKVELWLNRAETSLGAFKAAKQLDPENKDAADKIKLAEDAVKESQAAFEKNLKNEKLKWPGNNKDWSGEGDPDTLCAAAMDYLKKNPDKWGDAYKDDPAVPIAVCLKSQDWQVWKEVLGMPTQYNLDFVVAFAGKKQPKYAYRYYYTFYTKEEGGVKKAAPFYFANPHQYAHFMVLRDDVPAGGSGSAGRKSTSGCMGFLFRLILGCSLILGGFIAAVPAIIRRIPQLTGLYDAVAPKRGQIGALLLIIGLLFFLRATVWYFSPFADLLPQFAAILLGLILGWELIVKKSAGFAGEMPGAAGEKVAGDSIDQAKAFAGETAQKAQAVLLKNQERIRQLEQKQVPIGLAGIILGVIHLLAGGIWLF